MSLDKLLKRQRERVFPVDIGDGLVVRLRPAVGRDVTTLAFGGMSLRMGPDRESTDVVPDPERLIPVLNRLLVDWEGMTPAMASDLLQAEIPGDKLIQPTEVNRHTMVRESAEFRGRLVNALMKDAEKHRADRKKKLNASEK